MVAPSLLLLAVPGLMIHGQLAVSLSPWTAPCRGFEVGASAKCDVPKALGTSPLKFLIPLADVTAPGQAARVVQDFKTPDIQGRVTVFSVDPPAASRLPLYLQIKLEITAPVRAVCAESVRYQPAAMEIPPVVCAGYSADAEWGLTSLFEISTN